MISGIIYMIGVIVMDFFYPALYGICGIIIGSFLNVCILRIPEGQSFVTGRSHCPACKRPVSYTHLDVYKRQVLVLQYLLGSACRVLHAELGPLPVGIQVPGTLHQRLGMGIHPFDV